MADLVEKLAALLPNKKKVLATAESCTGGLLAATITQRPGISANFERGFITYSNESKTEMLGVSADKIAEHGAVSDQVAIAMAMGALEHSHASISISITGIAGPDGGSEQKPVGLVYFGYALKGVKQGSVEHHFKGSRAEIQRQAVQTALQLLIRVLEEA